MQDHDAKRHPGPWRVMQLDSEFAGLLVAVGFLVMGLVSMPLATGFVLGAIALGVVVALLLRFTPRKLSRVVDEPSTKPHVGSILGAWGKEAPWLRPRDLFQKYIRGHLQHGQVGPGILCTTGLLLADERTVDVEVVQHDHAGAGFRSIVQNNVDAFHFASRRDGRGCLCGVAGIEAQTLPSGCG